MKIIKLATHGDERGFFRELLRAGDGTFPEGAAQFSHSQVGAGVLKAWHSHKRQHQWNYPAAGLFKVALHDARPGSPTRGETMDFLAGEGQPGLVYSFPPGVLHGYRVLRGPAHILYITSGTYDPEGDEARLPADDPAVGYDWGPAHG